MNLNPIHKFLIYCSGAHIDTLIKCPTDINRYVGIGGVVFFTGVLASLSSGYALFTIFESIWSAIGFGLLWGTMIFNLDRYIVSSMKKTGPWYSQWAMAIPRLALAGVLGVVISKPLELKIFEKEIDKQLNLIIARNKAKLQQEIITRYDIKGANFKSERDSILARQKRLKEELASATVELEKEIVGTASETTTGKKGYGSVAKRKEALKAEREAEYKEFIANNKSKLDSFDQMMKRELQALNDEINMTATKENRYNGLAARMQALKELGQEYYIIEMASLFVMLLFIFMELAPVLVKLIAPKGPYDYLLDEHEYDFYWINKEENSYKDIINSAKINLMQQEVEKVKSSRSDLSQGASDLSNLDSHNQL